MQADLVRANRACHKCVEVFDIAINHRTPGTVSDNPRLWIAGRSGRQLHEAWFVFVDIELGIVSTASALDFVVWCCSFGYIRSNCNEQFDRSQGRSVFGDDICKPRIEHESARPDVIECLDVN